METEPFAMCHSERSEESRCSPQDKLREESHGACYKTEILRLGPQNDISTKSAELVTLSLSKGGKEGLEEILLNIN